jgi:hypothetical protein
MSLAIFHDNQEFKAQRMVESANPSARRTGMAHITTRNLAQAKEAAGMLLDELGLAAYLFEVEPREDGDWQVRVDCAADGGWRSLVIPVDAEQLLDAAINPTARALMLEHWSRTLGDRRAGLC